MTLDKTDRELINILQQDSKITTKRIASQLNLSVTAIYERIRKLEKKGIIEKYIALINTEKVSKDFIVFVQVKLKQHHIKFIEKFEKEVLQFDEVLECFNVSGDYDYQLKIIVENMKAYREFLNNKLTTLDYIGSTYSTFIISVVKNSTTVLL
ncbi:MAG: Lrp/AsnC family transcriptional regulator [Flavobacteriaceae bacterium]